MIEEFGFPRDGGSFDAGTPTTYKDRFYGLIYELVEGNMRAGGPAAGANFWGWGGEGRAQHADHHFVRGDTSYLGDPPHEPQGWYSVYDTDASDPGGHPQLCGGSQGDRLTAAQNSGRFTISLVKTVRPTTVFGTGSSVGLPSYSRPVNGTGLSIARRSPPPASNTPMSCQP